MTVELVVSLCLRCWSMTHSTHHTFISNLGTEAHCYNCSWRYSSDDESGTSTYIHVFNQAMAHEDEFTCPEPEAKSTWVPVNSTSSPDVLPAGEALVWVHDEFYEGVTIGWRAHSTWYTIGYKDDCSVTHWAPMVKPSPPAEVLSPPSA